MTPATDGSLSAPLVILGALLIAFSGVPSLFTKKTSGFGQQLASLLVTVGALCGLIGAFSAILLNRSETFVIEWGLPFDPCEIALDPFSGLFLLPIFFISACCSIYGVGYWPATEHAETTRKITFFFGLTAASMALLVMAKNMVLFLVAWEVMALSAYFILAAEDHRKEVREAGFIYLAATHTGTLALFAMFAMLHSATSSFLFPPAATIDAAMPLSAAILVAALIGFGMKAGLMPLHVWLPSAHANAPSHISAIMSGVLIKMGIYGIIRVVSFFSHPPLWWGAVILSAGMITAVLGVTFAMGQKDIKRLLAYSSIDNIGIIAMGIGVAVIGQATGSNKLAILGMAGALLHVLNHGIFKPLLFLNAGSVIHATGTREIDAMGGLARTMPATSILFLTGSLAICGLPPLNGFVGEYLVYLALFTGAKDGGGGAAAFMALAVPALALTGGLALACFVKLYGTAFLGLPRSGGAEHPHEAGGTMLAPMRLLAFLSLFIGLFPPLAIKLLHYPLLSWSPSLARSGLSLSTLAPVTWLTVAGVTLAVVAILLYIFYDRQLKNASRQTAATWGCGYVRPSVRMQYTSSSFSETLVLLFRGVLRPRVKKPELRGYFPATREYASSIPDMVLDLIILPVSRAMDFGFSFIRKLQHGEYHLYILYIFVTMIALLIWAH